MGTKLLIDEYMLIGYNMIKNREEEIERYGNAKYHKRYCDSR